MSRKALILFFSLTLPGCLAQTAGSSPTTAASPNQARSHRESIPGGVRTMRGCISKNDEGEYFLVPQRGTKVQLRSAEDLAPHVGQQVKVSGSFIDPPASPPRASTSPEISAPNDIHHDHEFHVLKIDILSPSCPAGKKK